MCLIKWWHHQCLSNQKAVFVGGLSQHHEYLLKALLWHHHYLLSRQNIFILLDCFTQLFQIQRLAKYDHFLLHATLRNGLITNKKFWVLRCDILYELFGMVVLKVKQCRFRIFYERVTRWPGNHCFNIVTSINFPRLWHKLVHQNELWSGKLNVSTLSKAY